MLEYIKRLEGKNSKTKGREIKNILNELGISFQTQDFHWLGGLQRAGCAAMWYNKSAGKLLNF